MDDRIKKTRLPGGESAGEQVLSARMKAEKAEKGQTSIAEMFPETGQNTNFVDLTDHDPFSASELSDEEALARLREADVYASLPNPPKIPGFHLYWATTMEGVNDVFKKRQLGYAFVKPEEVPGFRYGSNRSGAIEGDVVSHNEMILMKVPERLHQLYMTEYHHVNPQSQEQAVKERVRQRLSDGQYGTLARVEEADTGFKSLGENRKAPVFS